MSVARRLAHKFSLTCHNRFIAGCCRKWQGHEHTRAHTATVLWPRIDYSSLFPHSLGAVVVGDTRARAAAPYWQRSGRRAGLGLAGPDNHPTHPWYRDEERRGGQRDEKSGIESQTGQFFCEFVSFHFVFIFLRLDV